MGKIYNSVTELIGGTPLLKANNFIKANGLKANVFVKLEYFNPAGSVKDRIAKAMIEQAEKDGKLKPGATIIEPTSGNTGIGLASVAAARGYKAILTMPETMSVERRNLLKAYGAKIVLTDGSKGMKGAIAKAEELAKETPNSFIPEQFANPANPAAHEATTGPEIYNDLDGKVDAFIAGVGTGGTLSGVGHVEDFAHGKIRLFETKVRRSSPLANIPLKDIEFPKGVLAGMIFRDHRMIIPHGDDCLLPHDNAYFIGIPEEIEKFSQTFVQRDARKLHRVVIIGAGRAGRALAPMLEKQGVRVKVIDKDPDRCRLMADKLVDGIAICGDGTDIDLLTEEGVAEADVVVCLTEDDKLNLMLALLARHMSHNKTKTVVRVARNEYVELMEKVGVDIVLSARLLSASEVLAFARRGGVVSVSLLEGAKAEAVEVIVQEGAPVAGKPLMEAKLPRACLVCAYVRDGEAVIPNGATVLQPGDRTILFIQTQFSKKVMQYFKGRE